MQFEPISLILALIFGLIPLFIGMKKKKMFYAVVGCLSTVLISGTMHIGVSIGVSLLFIWLILKVEQDSDEE